MKIYISLDMEGMPGTFNWEQEKTDRPAVRRHITHHVNTVLKAILDSPQNAAIDGIVIADSHSAGDNLDYEITALDPRIELISGYPRPCYMMPDLSKEFDQVFLLGYHSGVGALHGNMDHTYSSSRIHKISINGKPMNEALINAAYAGHLGIPVSLVTGDEALRQELLVPLPWIGFVATKKALSRFAARNYSQGRVDSEVGKAVHSALARPQGSLPVYSLEAPLVLTIEFNTTVMADQACLMPRVKRLDGRTIEYREDDYAVLFEAIMALVTLT